MYLECKKISIFDFIRFNGAFKVLEIIIPSHQDVFVKKSVAAAVLLAPYSVLSPTLF